MKDVSAVNRAHRIAAPVYCGRVCAGLARRRGKTAEQKKAAKAEYDRAYRAQNLDWLKAKKKAYFQRTYDPVKAAIERKKRMPRHVAYCQRPEYKAWKHEYDRKYNMVRSYGPLWEAARVLVDLQTLIRERSTTTERKLQNGTLNKTQQRKRRHAQAAADQSRPTRRNRA